jgi:hypothetical protein
MNCLSQPFILKPSTKALAKDKCWLGFSPSIIPKRILWYASFPTQTRALHYSSVFELVHFSTATDLYGPSVHFSPFLTLINHSYPPQPTFPLQFYVVAQFCQPDSLYPADESSISSEKLVPFYKNKQCHTSGSQNMWIYTAKILLTSEVNS